MLPRYAADYRTLLWTFVLFPGVALAHYARPGLVGWLLPVSLYLGFCAGVFSHNHNHCPTFTSRRVNAAFGAWLSFFYGYPTFAWIPTHNLNHHKFVNRAGDATITWRYTKAHTFWVAATYFFVSAYFQGGPLKEFIARARAQNPRLYRQIVVQYAIVFGGHAAMLALAIALHGVGTGLLVYAFAFLVPALFALWSMMFINYVQHVHCDPWSKHDHSRNFVSRLGNWLVFNNGFHTAHHEHAGAHWTTLPALHARIAAQIHPALKQSSILGFCLRTYVLGLFSGRRRTAQIGRAPYDPPGGAPVRLETARIGPAVEAGINAPMAESAGG